MRFNSQQRAQLIKAVRLKSSQNLLFKCSHQIEQEKTTAVQ